MNRGDDRGVSPVVGFVILFGVFTIAMTIWQVQIVPSQNAQTEFEHQQRVTTDLVALSNAITGTTRGDRASPRVDLGTTYTDRTLFVNPPPPTGDLRTTSNRSGVEFEVRLDNVTAVGTVAGPASNWNGGERTYQTAALVYRPGYHSYQGPDTVVAEHGTLYSEIRDRRITHTANPVVDGDDIQLPLLEAGFTERSLEPRPITVEPVTPATSTVSVESNASHPITISLTSTSPDVLAAAVESADRVAAVDTNDTAHTVTATLEPGTYDLQTARVRLGGQATSDPAPSYVAVTEGNGETINTGQETALTVEVRDDTDNPLANQDVTLDLGGDPGLVGLDSPSGVSVQGRTDDQGRLEAVYQGSDPGSVTIDVTHSGGAQATTARINVTTGSPLSSTSTVEWARDRLVTEVGQNHTLRAVGNPGANVSFAVQNQQSLRATEVDSTFNTTGNATIDLSVLDGYDRLYAYATSLGQGDRLPIELPGKHIWRTAQDWANATRTDDVITDTSTTDENATVSLGHADSRAGLIGYWPLDDDNSSTVVDASGNGHHGTVENATGVTQGRAGIEARAHGFPQNDTGAITVNSTDRLSGGPDATLTGSVWFKPTSREPNATIFGKQNDGTTGDWGLVVREQCQPANNGCQPNRGPYVGYYSEIGGGDYTLMHSVDPHEWHHVAFVLDQPSDTLELYLDGELVESDTATGQISANTSADVEFGRTGYTDSHYVGDIDEARLYDRLLSESAIETLYETTIEGLEGYWPLDETGTTVVEAGVANITQSGPNDWSTVSYNRTYENPVVVAGPATHQDGDPAVIRGKNSTQTGFEVQLDEWGYLDGAHGTEDVPWFVTENGTHEIDGATMQAGTVSVDDDWKTVSLSDEFDQSPIVITTVMSDNGDDTVVTREQSVSKNSFQVEVEESEGQDGDHPFETVHYVAIEPITTDGLVAKTVEDVTNLTTRLTYDGFSSTPATVAQLQTHAGPNTGWVRQADPNSTGVDVFVEEERSNDPEIDHTEETVSFLGVRPGVRGPRTFDASGSGNTGLPTGPIRNVSGVFESTAYEFNGSTDSVTTKRPLDETLGETASLSAWINTTTVGDDTAWQAPGITGVEEDGGTNDIFWGWIDGDGQIGLQAGNIDGPQSTTNVSDGNWHHVVLTYRSSDGRAQVYVNGTLEATGTTNPGPITTPFESLGRIEDTGGTPEYFDGRLDEIRLYDRLLTGDEIAQLAGEERGDLVADWPLGQNTSTTVPDESGAGNDATIVENDSVVVTNGAVNSTAYDFTSDSAGALESASTAGLSGGPGATLTGSVWFKPATIPDSGFRVTGPTLVGKQANDSHTDWSLSVEQTCPDRANVCRGPGPYVGFYSSNGPDDYGVFDTTSVGQWHHVAFVLNERTDRIRLYQDGDVVVDDTFPGQISANTSSGVEIGRTDHTNTYFEGAIDDVKLYNRTLSEAELDALYPVTEEGTLVTDWHTGPMLSKDTVWLTNAEADLNGEDIAVFVESDTDDDGAVDETSNPVILDDKDTYAVSGLASDNQRFRLRVEFDTTRANVTPILDGLRLDEPEPAHVGEGNVTTFEQSAASDWNSVSFNQSYDDPVVVTGPVSYNGADPVTLRGKNVTEDGFEVQIDEWGYLDGVHTTEDVPWLVVERGTHRVGSATLQAGTVQVTDSWTTVSLDSSFDTTPAVVTSVMSKAADEEVVTRQRNVDSNSFQVRLQESEFEDGSHTAETVHYVASEAVTEDGIVAKTTGNSVDDGTTTIGYSGFSRPPATLAQIQTFDGPDTATLRHQSRTSASVDVFVEEEQSNDGETNHTSEIVSLIAVRGDLTAQTAGSESD